MEHSRQRNSNEVKHKCSEITGYHVILSEILHQLKDNFRGSIVIRKEEMNQESR